MRRYLTRRTFITQTGALRAWVDLAVVVVSVGALCWFTIAYVQQQTRYICGIIVLIDDRNQTLPQGDPDTERFRAELHNYRNKIGCP